VKRRVLELIKEEMKKKHPAGPAAAAGATPATATPAQAPQAPAADRPTQQARALLDLMLV